jgi:hypothetical protein
MQTKTLRPILFRVSHPGGPSNFVSLEALQKAFNYPIPFDVVWEDGTETYYDFSRLQSAGIVKRILHDEYLLKEYARLRSQELRLGSIAPTLNGFSGIIPINKSPEEIIAEYKVANKWRWNLTQTVAERFKTLSEYEF